MRISDWSSDVFSSDRDRTYHLQHHKYTQQPEDPDLSLSKPFPTTRASLWRKVLRDLTGQTFFKQRVAQFDYALVGLKAMLRGETADKKARASTRAGTVFTKQSDDGMTSPTADLSGARAVARAVGRLPIGRAQCRESVCQNVKHSVVAVS